MLKFSFLIKDDKLKNTYIYLQIIKREPNELTTPPTPTP